MRGSRALDVATLAGLIVVIVWVVDLLVADDMTKSVTDVARVIVIVGAVVCVAVLYQLWSVRRHHAARDHAAVAAALLGGALVASSAFSAPAGEIFGNSLTAAAGVAGLALALYGARPARINTEGH